ncbi:hypothetical protein CERZMDRAFT_80568 [Cercospora zeae-maydis SCOH1-5]|uniref:Uncharacterized protein n=1 Tax=Cercospora zeae-maydis SCOH1-5 TaxID=717836 RepID=A0A6A6FWW0_9PEZI|nr:hypothetical protein CERZMDRAFT_80568 [Cercospora zeae-maydis SCOH1-5]
MHHRRHHPDCPLIVHNVAFAQLPMWVEENRPFLHYDEDTVHELYSWVDPAHADEWTFLGICQRKKSCPCRRSTWSPWLIGVHRRLEAMLGSILGPMLESTVNWSPSSIGGPAGRHAGLHLLAAQEKSAKSRPRPQINVTDPEDSLLGQRIVKIARPRVPPKRHHNELIDHEAVLEQHRIRNVAMEKSEEKSRKKAIKKSLSDSKTWRGKLVERDAVDNCEHLLYEAEHGCGSVSETESSLPVVPIISNSAISLLGDTAVANGKGFRRQNRLKHVKDIANVQSASFARRQRATYRCGVSYLASGIPIQVER